MKKINEYEDIINLPHHKSETRKSMPIIDRAAQFSPFAALTGYSEVIEETARLTLNRIELDEQAKTILNNKLWFLLNHINDKIEVSITYFVSDMKKDGGAYISERGIIKKIKEFERIIIMENEKVIPIDEIICIEGEFPKSI